MVLLSLYVIIQEVDLVKNQRKQSNYGTSASKPAATADEATEGGSCSLLRKPLTTFGNTLKPALTCFYWHPSNFEDPTVHGIKLAEDT